MKENAAIKAGALDDPKLRMGITNLPVRSWDFRQEDMTGKEIGISQMFPWPGMRKTRTEMVLREKEEAQFVLEEMRSTMRSEIKMTYAELASVRKQIEAVRRSQDVLKDVVGVAEEIYAVGKGSQPDVLRGQLEYGRNCGRCGSLSRTGNRFFRCASIRWRRCPRTGRFLLLKISRNSRSTTGRPIS